MKKPYKGALRTQTIVLKNGLKVIINHDWKEKCIHCGGEVVGGLIPLELVSLALWDIHKCKKSDEEKA